jgi:hypothetical protein
VELPTVVTSAPEAEKEKEKSAATNLSKDLPEKTKLAVPVAGHRRALSTDESAVSGNVSP